MESSWILASFQGCRGWEKLDVPWFLSLQKKPTRIALTRNGLEIEFPEEDTGYIFSMPFYGFEKLPQENNDLCENNQLPSRNVHPWQWTESLPPEVIQRCDWWAGVAKSYPVSFSETYSIDPSSDAIVFHQSYDWLTIEDSWGTRPRRFATISPALGLAWKFGFPATFSSDIYDPDYFTGFGPYAGALDVDQLDISMHVLQYIHELEYLEIPEEPDVIQKKALDRLQLGMREKFQDGTWRMDYGEDNYVWCLVQDVWYSKGLEYIDELLRRRAIPVLRDYYSNRVIKEYSPHKGKYIVHGPGIGSWNNFGDAGKFATNMLQGIWGYGQYTGDWDLIRDRWESHVKKYFITPEEANWVFYGRGSICELGDEAPPCSAYARIAYAVGDYDEYAFGCYMFARELVHHWIKQKAGVYFYEHQPHQYFEAMPRHIYPTNVYRNSLGWQVDGPAWGHGEHQSSNRWVRFHDPDAARFYRDHLKPEVRNELDWYNTEGRKDGVYRAENYREWTERDKTHILTGLARLRSFLLGESYPELQKFAPMENYRAHSPAENIAVGYSFLRSMVPVKYRRLVPRDQPRSPRLLGLQRRGLEDYPKVAQECYSGGGNYYPAWYVPNSDWGMPEGTKESRRFGGIVGDFNARMKVEEKWTGYGCLVSVGRLP
ncbi:MAG: hypothetical protein JW793_15460 [Acidobacteria bacterium]|nr:hypothetical protein [Acidobacteriota bacterium]